MVIASKSGGKKTPVKKAKERLHVSLVGKPHLDTYDVVDYKFEDGVLGMLMPDGHRIFIKAFAKVEAYKIDDK